GHPGARVGRPLRRPRCRCRRAARHPPGSPRAAAPVSRLRGLAAALAHGRGLRASARLVAGAARPCPPAPPPARRPPPGPARPPPGPPGGLGARGGGGGAPPFMVPPAALAASLSRLSGQERVVVGLPIANRTQGETEGLIGFFVNTLALPVDLAGAESFS